MTKRVRLFPAAMCVAALSCVVTFAQTPGDRQAGAQPQSSGQPPPAVSADPVANEIGLLRRSLQTLNTRLREIGEKLSGAEAAGGRQAPLAQNLDILTKAEQRAEMMRRQLIELIEKETAFRMRMAQLDEEMRPDSIERSVGMVGTTRTTELRDTRRRVLDNERRGVEGLLNQAAVSRTRLEEDLKQADAMVARIRQRLLPLIEREIDKLNPTPE